MYISTCPRRSFHRCFLHRISMIYSTNYPTDSSCLSSDNEICNSPMWLIELWYSLDNSFTIDFRSRRKQLFLRIGFLCGFNCLDKVHARTNFVYHLRKGLRQTFRDSYHRETKGALSHELKLILWSVELIGVCHAINQQSLRSFGISRWK